MLSGLIVMLYKGMADKAKRTMALACLEGFDSSALSPLIQITVYRVVMGGMCASLWFN